MISEGFQKYYFYNPRYVFIFIFSNKTCPLISDDQRSPLHNASVNGYVKIVKALILLGAQVEAKDNFGKTPLHFASYADVAKCLIQNGAKMDAKDENGETPLYIASAEGRAEIVKCLIKMGAKIEAKDNLGQTPLHIAGDVEVAKCLIRNGAQSKAKDNDGNTPLHLVKDLELVKYLIESGAQIDITNNANKTPFELADESEHYDAAKYLLEQKKESELKNPSININNQALCIVCLTPRNGLYVLHPCGHVSLCESCCYKLKRERYSKCPSCRKPIKDYKKIYFQEPELK